MDEQLRENKSAKIVVAEDGDAALERMVARVNDGFRGGRVGKQELATWIVCRFEKQGFEGDIEAIRADHFDEVMYLDAVVRELRAAKRDGGSPIDMVSLLAPLTSPLPPRRPRGRPRKGLLCDPSQAPSR